MGGQRAIAVKVAVLIVISLALLGLFIVSMGDVSFQPTYTLLVGFDDPANLKVGAPVHAASVKIGTVQAIDYIGGGNDPKTGELLTMVRVRIRIEKRYQSHIHDDAEFYLTTRGLLADQLLVVDPGTAGRPHLPDGASVRGREPPRLDRILAETSEFLTSMTATVREHRPGIRSSLLRAAKALRRTGAFMDRNEGRLDSVGAELEQLSFDAVETVRQMRRTYVDNPKIDSTIAEVDRVAAQAGRDVPELLADGREAMADARRYLHQAAGDGEGTPLGDSLADVSSALADAKGTARSAREAVRPIRRGQGQLGSLLMDERLYDDLQETIVHLRKNPWKFFWRE